MDGLEFGLMDVELSISGNISILPDEEETETEANNGSLFPGTDTEETSEEETSEEDTAEEETSEEETEEETDSAIGAHNFEAGVVIEPTCTEDGYTEYTCTDADCGEVFIKDVVEATGHSYEAVVTEATEELPGYITYTCSVCGDTYTENIETEEETSAGQEESGGALSGILGYAIVGAAGFVIGIVLTAIVLSRLMKKRRRKKALAASEKSGAAFISNTSELSPDSNIIVGKLHAQGARENQQDSFAVSPPEMMKTHGILAVVADGMGGLSGGEKVSQMAVSTMMDGFAASSGNPDRILLNLLQKANGSVNHMLGPAGLNKSGSTMVAAIIKNGMFHYISVGDSRIALLRDGVLYQLNRDHVYCNDLAIDAVNGKGTVAGAFSHPKAHGLTSFLGMGRLKYIDIPAQPIAVRPGDRFALMSDGVYNALTAKELADALSRPAQESADYLGKIIQQKNYSTQDNYTAVILTVQQ